MENTKLKRMIYLEVTLFQETSLNVFFHEALDRGMKPAKGTS
jgi:hypothetical protein